MEDDQTSSAVIAANVIDASYDVLTAALDSEVSTLKLLAITLIVYS